MRLALLMAALILIVVLAVVFVDCGGPAAGVSEVAPTASASPSSSSSPSETLFIPSANRRLRLQNYGDSMGGEVGWALVPILRESGVVRPWTYYKVSSSLVKPTFFNWPQYVRRDLEGRQIDAVVFMVGTNDGQGMVQDGAVLPFGTAAWKKEYARRVGVVLDALLAPPARRVYWVGMPIMRSRDFSSVMRLINTVAAAEVERHPGARFVETWKLVSTSAGAYDARWRQDDGVHFNIDGTQRVANAVFAAIKKDWQIE